MKRILIVKISSLGDVLHAFPAVSLVRKKFPRAEIDWLVNPAFAPILEYNKDVSRVILFPRADLASPLAFPNAFKSLVGQIRREKYDMVIDLQGLFRSAFFAKFAKSPAIAGFASPREKFSSLLYSHRIAIGKEHVHAVEKNARMVSLLFDIPFTIPDTVLPENARNSKNLRSILGRKGIADDEVLIAIAPGARWESKQWPPEFFAEVADKACAGIKNSRFLLLGSPDEIEICWKIASSCRKARTAVLAGETGIGELVEAIRISKCLICNDSGPMHIAASLHVPVFAFFGPTDPARTGPHGKGHSVFKPDLSCIKCLKRYCPQRNYLCHSSVAPSSVASGIISLLR